jgi:hypothetical protein
MVRQVRNIGGGGGTHTERFTKGGHGCSGEPKALQNAPRIFRVHDHLQGILRRVAADYTGICAPASFKNAVVNRLCAESNGAPFS